MNDAIVNIRVVLEEPEWNTAMEGLVWYKDGRRLRRVNFQVKRKNSDWEDVPVEELVEVNNDERRTAGW